MRRTITLLIATAIAAFIALPAFGAGPSGSGTNGNGDCTAAQTQSQQRTRDQDGDCTGDGTIAQEQVREQARTQTQLQSQVQQRLQTQDPLGSCESSVAAGPGALTSTEPSGTAALLKTATQSRLQDGTGDGIPDMLRDRIGQPEDAADVPESNTPEWVDTLVRAWNRFTHGVMQFFGDE
jgi:hypothetical protein